MVSDTDVRCANTNRTNIAVYTCQVSRLGAHCNRCYTQDASLLHREYRTIRACVVCKGNVHTQCSKEEHVGGNIKLICDTCRGVHRDVRSTRRTDLEYNKEGCGLHYPRLQRPTIIQRSGDAIPDHYESSSTRQKPPQAYVLLRAILDRLWEQINNMSKTIHNDTNQYNTI